MSEKKHQFDSPESNSPVTASRRLPLWQALALPVAAIIIFFLLLEGVLALFGIHPALQTEDPFVGFAANAPLFVPSTGENGQQVLATAPNKKDFFNYQSFPQEKAPGSYRIFCLGGSTTYGRPYDDTTSFSGWLRELLPTADKSKNWEVINAGGISYASYRVAQLMEELVHYQPDLFIIYTGHNEFLEERTYRKLREMPPLIRSTSSLLAKTRTWSAMSSTLQSLHIAPQTEKEGRFKLGTEVDAILDRSAGLERYSRDDALRENILKHYRISLEHMVMLARSVGAQVIFVTPTSNLKDCSPFKSQDTAGISDADRQRSEDLLAMSKPLIWDKQWSMVLQFLDEAVALNPRNAELHYRRGQALLALGRFDEAKRELLSARDEDVCPLRALTPMGRIVAEVAREQGVLLVDFVDSPRAAHAEGTGIFHSWSGIFSRSCAPDHRRAQNSGCRPVRGHDHQGLMQTGPGWSEKSVATVAAKIEGRIDQEAQGRALANLARVLLWAGKNDDAARLAKQALDIGGEYQQVAVNAATSLATAYVRNGQPQLAVKQLYSSLEKAPNAVELRLKLGQILLDRQLRNPEEAAANFLLVSQQMPYYDWAHALFGIDMAERGRPRIAYPSLMEALRLNPNNTVARQKLDQIRPLLAGHELSPQPALIQLDHYPSMAPLKLVQGRLNSSGIFIPDGIEADFHENGRLKRFLDIDQGKANGLEMTWDTDGRLLSRQAYQQGTPVNGEAGK